MGISSEELGRQNPTYEKRLAGYFCSDTVSAHLFPVHLFSSTWKHQKTVSLSEVFMGKRKGALETNALT